MTASTRSSRPGGVLVVGHAVVMSLVAAALLAAMLATALVAWRRALPGAEPTRSPAAQRVLLESGQSVWQTMYVPVCLPARLDVELAEPVVSPGSLAIAWFALEDASRWPAAPVAEATVVLGPGDTHVSIAVPPSARIGGRLAGLRLTADRTSVVLPITRDNVVSTGYLTRRAGYVSTDDLMFRADYADGGGSSATRHWLAGLSCVPRTQPDAFNRPVLLAIALVVTCLAAAWLAGLVVRTL